MTVQNIYLSIIGTALISCFWCIGFMVVIKKLILQEVWNIDIDAVWDDIPRWGKLILKPLFACPACMASIHGTVIYFTFLFPLIGFWFWLPFCVCLCGLNFFVSQFFVE